MEERKDDPDLELAVLNTCEEHGLPFDLMMAVVRKETEGRLKTYGTGPAPGHLTWDLPTPEGAE